MNAKRFSLAVIGTLLVGAGLRVTVNAPVRWYEPTAAALRLSWSARPERLEVCREPTAAEIAARPAHMQRTLECSVSFATYDLRVLIDDTVLAERVVLGGGLRNDRPLHLLEEYAVPSGERRLRVELHRREEAAETHDAALTVAPLDSARSAREIESRRQRQLAALAPRLVLDTLVQITPGRVLLVTYDGQGQFVLLR